jgi:hypothetical protein
MNSFAMIFGKCVWIPPSPKAVLALSCFFGIVPGASPSQYEYELRGQLVAAGASEDAATAEIKWLNNCFSSYVPPAHQ